MPTIGKSQAKLNFNHYWNDFKKLSIGQRLTTIALTALAALGTLGLAAPFVFRSLVGRFKKKNDIKNQQLIDKNEKINTIASTNSTSPLKFKQTIESSQTSSPVKSKPILEKNIKPVINLESLEQYKKRLQKIDLMTNELKPLAALKKENQSKNRYNNILPNENSRVKLTCQVNGSDYINANHVLGMIMTQGPLPNTQTEFWLTAFENNCQIVCLTDAICSKTKNTKTHDY